MTSVGVETTAAGSKATTFDVIVIGAGFSGLYMVYKLRELGFSVRALEMGDGVGGTWYWNRYPGARVDVQSVEYSYSFSEEIQQEWEWKELMAPQSELEAYLNFVADRLDLRKDIQLGTKVTAMAFGTERSRWTVETEQGQTFDAQFVVGATGCLSAPTDPDIPGLRSFEGVTLFTNRFPKEGFDFTGKRVAVVGTGSSGVQSIPVIAEEAGHLWVFQRSAAYARPSGNRPYQPGEFGELRKKYPDMRAAERQTFAGTVFSSAVAFYNATAEPRRILETPVEERLAVVDEHGWSAPMLWSDIAVNIDANNAANELYAELVRRAVSDPATAEALVPHYPVGCKRLIIDSGYYETFNRENVTLVDLRKDPLVEVTRTGIRTQGHEYEVDVIVYATGFDAMIGSLARIDITGLNERSLGDFWRNEGPYSYLGLQVAGFPNLFTVTGPGSPSVNSNMVVSIEHHVEWIADCLGYMRDHGYTAIQTTDETQQQWMSHVFEVVSSNFPVRIHDTCNSWYVGANVPGKQRIYSPYLGGLPAYTETVAKIVANGYQGFVFSGD
jgi:cation diffusion facilitator CzcD-associated flavoprotein CzcO